MFLTLLLLLLACRSAVDREFLYIEDEACAFFRDAGLETAMVRMIGPLSTVTVRMTTTMTVRRTRAAPGPKM